MDCQWHFPMECHFCDFWCVLFCSERTSGLLADVLLCKTRHCPGREGAKVLATLVMLRLVFFVLDAICSMMEKNLPKRRSVAHLLFLDASKMKSWLKIVQCRKSEIQCLQYYNPTILTIPNTMPTILQCPQYYNAYNATKPNTTMPNIRGSPTILKRATVLQCRKPWLGRFLPERPRQGEGGPLDRHLPGTRNRYRGIGG